MSEETVSFAYQGFPKDEQKKCLAARAREVEEGLAYRRSKGSNGRVAKLSEEQRERYARQREKDAQEEVKARDASCEVQGTVFEKGKPVAVPKYAYDADDAPKSALYKKLSALCRGGSFKRVEPEPKAAPKAAPKPVTKAS